MKVSKLLNFAVFHGAWLAAMFVAAAGRPLIATLAPAAAVTLHLWWAGEHRRKELTIVASAAAAGLLLDGPAILLGLYSTSHGTTITSIIWFVALWANFATTLNSSLAWLNGKLWVAVVFGAIGGPLAYYGGQKIGAAAVSDTWTSWLWITLEYALATPVL
ncbi:MAG: DUF2878 domain-containing protein, partial [Phycisphaerales bacterium]